MPVVERVFQAALLASAFLLFLVQPLVARLLLPRFGGTPATWNACQAFFQATLLLGYSYAHLLTTRLGPRAQLVVHAAILALPALALPLAFPEAVPVVASPERALLALLVTRVALPFFAVSTTAPLLQRWFGATDHPDAKDPYFLYAASNAGSFLGLLAYPLVVEPRLTLGAQGKAWSLGFAGLAALVLACGLISRRTPATPAARGAPVDVLRAARWVLLAFLPSSLCLSVTTYLTTDVAAIPLLWVLPLSLYLLSFVAAFARRTIVPRRAGATALVLLLLATALLLLSHITEPMLAVNGLHVLLFAVAAYVLHRELALDRPGPEHLTGFYLLTSLGGVLGGVLNAFVAPAVFTTIAEYPLVLVATALVVPCAREERRRGDALVPFVTTGWAGTCAMLLPGTPLLVRTALAFLVPAVVLLLRSGSRLVLATGLAGLFLVGRFDPVVGNILYEERSFFGVHRVVDFRERGERFHALRHGSTIHGFQLTDPLTGEPRAPTHPLGYYHRRGPVGQIVEAKPLRAIGVVGLGAGMFAAYTSSGQSLTFFEIDPAVQRIAEDRHYFSFVDAARARGVNVSIVLGDARLTLRDAAAARFDLLAIDAFSSDAIPVHLVTREAFALYQERLAPRGMIAFHVSSRYLELEPVLAALGRDSGLVSAARFDRLDPSDWGARRDPSHWIVLARSREDLGGIARDPRWKPTVDDGRQPWTDDYADIISAFRWR